MTSLLQKIILWMRDWRSRQEAYEYCERQIKQEAIIKASILSVVMIGMIVGLMLLCGRRL